MYSTPRYIPDEAEEAPCSSSRSVSTGRQRTPSQNCDAPKIRPEFLPRWVSWLFRRGRVEGEEMHFIATRVDAKKGNRYSSGP